MASASLFESLCIFFFSSLYLKGQTVGGAQTLAICQMENSELVLYAVMFLQTAVMPPARRFHETKARVDSLFQLAISFLKASRPLFCCAWVPKRERNSRKSRDKQQNPCGHDYLDSQRHCVSKKIVSFSPDKILSGLNNNSPPPLWHLHLCRSMATNQMRIRLQVN